MIKRCACGVMPVIETNLISSPYSLKKVLCVCIYCNSVPLHDKPVARAVIDIEYPLYRDMELMKNKTKEAEQAAIKHWNDNLADIMIMGKEDWDKTVNIFSPYQHEDE